MNLLEVLNLDQTYTQLLTGISVRFVFNFIIASTIILLIYRRNSNNKDFCFTLFSFNLIIFALCTILNNVELSIGSGFGLFAVFTMMRYRSEQLQIKDMTYLLILVGLGFVNATYSSSIGILEIVFLNISILVILMVMEKLMFKKNVVKQKIKYNQLDLLKVGNKPTLRQDLENKLGARVEDIQVDSINYLDGSANLVVRYNVENPIEIDSFMELDVKNQDAILVKEM